MIKNAKVPAGSVTTNGCNGNFYYILYNLSGIRIFTMPRPVPRLRQFRATINTRFVYNMYNINYINMIYMLNRRRRFFGLFFFFLRALLSLGSRCLCFTLSPLAYYSASMLFYHRIPNVGAVIHYAFGPLWFKWRPESFHYNLRDFLIKRSAYHTRSAI